MNPIAAHGNSGWTQATKTASLMGENLSSRSESSSTLDYKLIAQLLFNIKLQQCGDHQLVPKVGLHLHLASSAVPRYQPKQAVATCFPNLVRRPRPLWCKISVLPHVAHGSATQSW